MVQKKDQGFKIVCPYGENVILIPLRAPFFSTFWKSKDFNLNIKKTHVLHNQQRVLYNQQRVLYNQQRCLHQKTQKS